MQKECVMEGFLATQSVPGQGPCSYPPQISFHSVTLGRCGCFLLKSCYRRASVFPHDKTAKYNWFFTLQLHFTMLMVFQPRWPHLQATLLPPQMNSNPRWKSGNPNSQARSHLGPLIISYVPITAGTHACTGAHKRSAGCHRHLAWIFECQSCSIGGRQRQGQREHLGRLPWGEWVCSSVGRLTHFIISLSHTPRIHCMHEQAKEIVKQAHVRTRRGANGSGIHGQRACLAMIRVLDENRWIKSILHLLDCAVCLFTSQLFLNANVGAAFWVYQEKWVNLKHLSKTCGSNFMVSKNILFWEKKK